MWNVKKLTTASATFDNVTFKGKGSLLPSGTFGGGTVDVFAKGVNNETGAEITSAVALVSIDGTTVKNAEIPNGTYKIVLTGSTGGDIDLFYLSNDTTVR